MRGGNAAERAKLGLRLSLHRAGVSIGRDPYVNRVARLLDAPRHHDCPRRGCQRRTVRPDDPRCRVRRRHPVVRAALRRPSAAPSSIAAGPIAGTPSTLAVGAELGPATIHVVRQLVLVVPAHDDRSPSRGRAGLGDHRTRGCRGHHGGAASWRTTGSTRRARSSRSTPRDSSEAVIAGAGPSDRRLRRSTARAVLRRARTRGRSCSTRESRRCASTASTSGSSSRASPMPNGRLLQCDGLFARRKPDPATS